MKIILNGRENIFECNTLNIKKLLQVKDFSAYRSMFVIINKKLIPEDKYETFQINENDKVDILPILLGG